MVERAADIVEELGLGGASGPEAPTTSTILEPLADRMVPGESYDLDALVALSGLDGPRVLARLTALEIAGIVAVSGGQYVRRA